MSAAHAVLPTKLRPALARRHPIAPDVALRLRPVPGRLVLVHAPAGSGKTTALAMTHEGRLTPPRTPQWGGEGGNGRLKGAWLWYNLDGGGRYPLTQATRLAAGPRVEPPPPDLAAGGVSGAGELAQRLAGRPLRLTLDRYEQVGDAPEVGRLLTGLLDLLPGLSLRIATRTRPLLPLERLRLEGRLVEVGLPDLRLSRERLAEVLAEALRRPAGPAELRFADTVLSGWPAAVRLWLAGMDEGETDLQAPLAPGRPLHDYLHEELLRGTLTPAQMETFRAEVGWLPGPGPVLDRAPTTERRLAIADTMIRHRVGVVLGPGGWHWHPLVARFLDMHHTGESHAEAPELPQAPGEPAVGIRTFGGLTVTVDGVRADEAGWPAASRRLLELLLCLPGFQTTARQAARLLWPRHLERSALNSFNVALHGLRRILEPTLTAGAGSRYVARQGRVYRLCLERLSCDVDRFWGLLQDVPDSPDAEGGARLERAAALYVGDFLAGSTEDFVQQRRAWLRSVALETLERLGEWHAEAGRDAEALRAFERLLELAPRREDVWARVLELHLAHGGGYRALAALERCEQSLSAAGIVPSGLLQELHRRVRQEPPSAAV